MHEIIHQILDRLPNGRAKSRLAARITCGDEATAFELTVWAILEAIGIRADFEDRNVGPDLELFGFKHRTFVECSLLYEQDTMKRWHEWWDEIGPLVLQQLPIDEPPCWVILDADYDSQPPCMPDPEAADLIARALASPFATDRTHIEVGGVSIEIERKPQPGLPRPWPMVGGIGSFKEPAHRLERKIDEKLIQCREQGQLIVAVAGGSAPPLSDEDIEGALFGQTVLRTELTPNGARDRVTRNRWQDVNAPPLWNERSSVPIDVISIPFFDVQDPLSTVPVLWLNPFNRELAESGFVARWPFAVQREYENSGHLVKVQATRTVMDVVTEWMAAAGQSESPSPNTGTR